MSIKECPLRKNVTEEFLREAISKTEKKDLIVTGITITRRPTLGEHFLTAVNALTAHTNVQDYHLVVKTMPEGEAVRKMAQIEGIMLKEIRMYGDLLPSLENIQRKRGSSVVRYSVPKYFGGFYNAVNATGALILEDLCHGGYEMGLDRLAGLDLQHCKLVMEELAKLHALSLATESEKPGFFRAEFSDVFDDFFFSAEGKMALKPIVDNGCTVAKQAALATNDPHFISQVEQLLTDDPFERVLDVLRLPHAPFGVVCHGDIHQSNMMFKYRTVDDDKIPTEVKLLDLQSPRYGFPTLDLAYFLFVSTTKETRKRHLHELFQIYHSAFVATLGHVNMERPDFTLDVLMEMFKKTGVFGVIAACLMIPAFLTHKDTHEDFGTQSTHEEFVASLDSVLKRSDGENTARITGRLLDVLQDAVDMGLHLR